MAYIFTLLIILASLGIGLLVWKYYGNNIKNKFNVMLKVKKSEKYWLKKIEKDPKNAAHFKGLGEWYIKKGQTTDAVQVLKYASRLAPTDMSVRERLEEIE